MDTTFGRVIVMAGLTLATPCSPADTTDSAVVAGVPLSPKRNLVYHPEAGRGQSRPRYRHRPPNRPELRAVARQVLIKLGEIR